MMLALAAVLFTAFVADVLMGALADTSILNDVQEMLMLFASSIVFVAAILTRERKSKEKSNAQ